MVPWDTGGSRMKDTKIVPFVCGRCLREVLKFSRTGGVPNMEIRVACLLTGHTAIAQMQARRIVGWKVYIKPAGWAPPKESPCRKESRP